MAERKLPDEPLSFIRDCIRGGRILWSYHVNMRLGQRFIARETIIQAAHSYEMVEAYPEDKYFPSYLLLGQHGGETFHVLFGADIEEQNVRVVNGILSEPGRVGSGSEDAKEVLMKCTVCGARMHLITTDLPFKLSEERIVILKQLPVLQCGACREYLIEDTVMARIDTLLARADSTAELEVIRYAA